jgi:hypothetical protein
MFASLTLKRALTGLLLTAAAAGATACNSDVTGPKPSDMYRFAPPTPNAGLALDRARRPRLGLIFEGPRAQGVRPPPSQAGFGFPRQEGFALDR